MNTVAVTALAMNTVAMNTVAVSWLGLAAALLLLPTEDPARRRVRALSESGRFDARPRSRLRIPQGMALPAVRAPAVGLVVGLPLAAGAGPPLGLAAGVVAAAAWHLGRDAARQRDRRRAASALLTAVRVMEAELAAGSRPEAALRAAAVAAPRHAAGLLALPALADGSALTRPPTPAATTDLPQLGSAWRLAVAAGAPLADVVGRVGDDLAARAQQQRTVSSALASARSSAALLALLPLLGICLGSSMDADPLGFLLAPGVGRWVLLVGVGLDATGLVWTQLLTRRAERA